MNSKYQVFVSSTYQDLKQERDLVIKAVLEMGHIPVGMEMFSAADEEQWSIIKKQIDQSDYYVVIAAHRYGSCDSSGVSYTEKEYDYATSCGIPILGFIVDDSIQWPKDKSDTDKSSIKKIGKFKDKIKQKPVSFWKTGEDLYGRCSIALIKAFNTYPREGWVRASKIQDVAAAKEILRLSAENSELRDRLAIIELSSSEDATISKTIDILRNNKTKISVWKVGSNDWERQKEVTLYQIYEVIAPEMQIEFSLSKLARYMATNVLSVPRNELRKDWPTPINTNRRVLADLSALECVQPSTKEKPVTDKDEYWCLTEFGMKIMHQIRRRRLEKVENLKQISPPSPEDGKIEE